MGLYSVSETLLMCLVGHWVLPSWRWRRI